MTDIVRQAGCQGGSFEGVGEGGNPRGGLGREEFEDLGDLDDG